METPDWAKLPGTLLAGGYEVEQCFEAGETSARFKVRVLGDRFTTATGEFFVANSIPAGQVEVWSAATALRHTNVSAPLTAGLQEFGNQPLAYFVEVQPDETLDGVIRERPLTAEEAREVTRAMTEGLAYLHANGFIQFDVQPSSVAAIGDRVCLRMRGARLTNAPLAPGEDASMDKDVRGLGTTVYTVLTQKPLEGDVAAAAEKLPPPFDFLVQKCLETDPQKRCSIPAVRSILSGELVPVKKIEATDARLAVEPLATPKASAASPIAADPVRSLVIEERRPAPPAPRPPSPAALSPAPSLPPPPTVVSERPVERGAQQRINWLIFVPVAALLLAALSLWVMRPKHAAAPSATSTAWPSHEVSPAPNSNAAATASTAAQSAPAPAPKAPIRTAARGGDIWRVVAFTFSREPDAQKRAKFIEEKHPGFHAEVFSPSGGAPYLVVLGGAMSREQAEQLRRKARASGLPRDTYMQNYSR